MAELTVRPGNPDFLDLPWATPLGDWDIEHLVELPKGISRHTVRFVAYEDGIYAIKELPTEPARRDYQILRALEPLSVPSVTAVGLVERRTDDPTEEQSAALITRYVDFSFSYRELLQGPGFGTRRNQMLDAFANLLVELHLAGCFWGDCSLSNVLYRYDGPAIETIMVDGETASIYENLSTGRREEDLSIMELNVAGGMADIAAASGTDLDVADLALGEDISARYRGLWNELTTQISIGPDERHHIDERIKRLNSLGFTVDEIEVRPDEQRMVVRAKVVGRTYHHDRLRELTGIDALENQARQILSDVYYYQARMKGPGSTGKSVAAVRWRVSEFEPMMEQLRKTDGVLDPLQAFCDVLHHRYLASQAAGTDVGTQQAYVGWVAEGRPGYDVSGNS